MNKYFFVLLIIIIFFISLSGIVSASDIAYVVKDTNHPEQNFINVINELGYTFDLIDDSDIFITDFSGYRFILIGDERIRNVPVDDYKSLIANPDYYTGWSNYVASVGKNVPVTAYNADSLSLITQGVPKYFQVYTQCCYGGVSLPLYYLRGRKYSVNSVTTTGDSIADIGNYVIATKDNPRRIFFGITKSDFWTDDSRKLFKNSIKWLISGEDRDRDGYYSEVDCNDNDASINPNATEIAYDRIDQNCDGIDLADTDLDGYCETGYSINNKNLQCSKETGSIGTDCNDNDININPGLTDIYKNCKNDAPIVDLIGKIIVSEGEIINIAVNSTDPENDALTYSINDSRFSRKNNVFTWKTGYNDYGNYIFKISVTDRKLTTSIDVELEVENVNQAPICNKIPSLEWNEDENATFNLNNYCNDSDGDAISFAFNDSSEDTHISLIEVGNGIIKFFSKKDWFGSDWIVFKITDGKSSILTEKINLNVKPVNDAPYLKYNIENITWNEDANFINKINLRNFFSDTDSSVMSFNVTGNNFIRVVINNSLVSFYPNKDWYGAEKIIFSATDGEFKTYSNEVLLTVLDANEPPEFSDIGCETNILEDKNYNCELNATDFEGDNFNFSITSRSHLNCIINGNILNYISDKDYNGSSSCLIRVSDSYGYNELLFNVNIENINDAPIIKSYSPANNPRIMNNKDFSFSIIPFDIDTTLSMLDVKWFLGNETAGSGNGYLFNKDKGIYNLTALVSDGEYESNHFWNVFVGSIEDFTCEEINGFVCSEKEICTGSLLGVLDSKSCCSIACSEKPPEFKDVKRRCINKSSEIKINFKDIDSGEEFNLGENIKKELEIRNDYNKNIKLDVEIYLYDLTKDRAINMEEYRLDVNKNSLNNLGFEIKIPGDLKDENKYALFVKADNDDNCNDNYIKITPKREGVKVIIEDIKVEREDLTCGDYLGLSVKVRNIGTQDQEARIKIKNPVLKINHESESFMLEKYKKKDTENELFNIQLPNDVKEGNYTLKISVLFGTDETVQEKEIGLESCEKEKSEQTEIKTISLTNLEKLTALPRIGNKKKLWFLAFNLISIFSVLSIISALLIHKNIKNKQAAEDIRKEIKNIIKKNKKIKKKNKRKL